jgi:hypothetical protein
MEDLRNRNTQSRRKSFSRRSARSGFADVTGVAEPASAMVLIGADSGLLLRPRRQA